jgi:hypothetical protein
MKIAKRETNMTKEIVQKAPDMSAIEKVVMQGDLMPLSPEQRVTYYRKVCESAGLNPFTNPFAYIMMNGKLTLYAKKDCTEQLRKIHGVSIEDLDDKIIDDLYIVKAKAKDRHGRMDESTGAVVIGNLRGEAKANAIMKCETKAKRRVTLSICGMGWTDESEIDSIPNAKPVDIDLSTGEIKDSVAALPEEKAEVVAKPKLSPKQVEDLRSVLDYCDRDYQKWFYDTVKKQYNGLENAPADCYERRMTAAIKKREEYQAKLMAEDAAIERMVVEANA